MKLSNIRFSLISTLILLISLLQLRSSSFAETPQVNDVAVNTFGNGPEELPSGFYLVIGVFEYEKNAKRMVANANREGLDAEYSLYPANGYYYVYTSSSEEKVKILEDYSLVRGNTSFHDAWLFIVRDEKKKFTTENPPEETISVDLTDDSSTIEDAFVSEVEEKKVTAASTKEKKILVIETTNSESGESVEAKIELVDGLRAKLINKLDSGTPWVVEDQDQLDTVHVISEALGYRKMQLEFIPNEPINDTTALYTHIANDTIFMEMELIELQKGDFQIMYNTYFYGNSTVMRDQSKYELEKLYDIMSGKPDMRIRLHGHTNGNSRGVAYLFQEKEKNYFDIRRTKEFTKRGVSSKKLSAYRAETIKSYLINKGIDSKRIETKGWGGKKLLYETDSPLAKNNIRVEIEVLSK